MVEGDTIEKIIKKSAKSKGFVYFEEPFTGREPDILLINKNKRKIIIIECSSYTNTRVEWQIQKYKELEKIFEVLGYSVETWLVADYITEYRKKNIEELGAKVVGAFVGLGDRSKASALEEMGKKINLELSKKV